MNCFWIDFTSFRKKSSIFCVFDDVDNFLVVDLVVVPVWTELRLNLGLASAEARTFTFHLGFDVDLDRSVFFVDCFFEILPMDYVKFYILLRYSRLLLLDPEVMPFRLFPSWDDCRFELFLIVLFEVSVWSLCSFE